MFATRESLLRLRRQIPTAHRHLWNAIAYTSTSHLGVRAKHGHVDGTSIPHAPLRKIVNGKHLNTLDRIFEHPANLNIHWKDVQKMFTSMGAEVTETNHARLKIKYNKHMHSFSLPTHGDLIESKDDLVGLRQFLQEIAKATPNDTEMSSATSGKHYLLVLDGKHSKLYHMLVKGHQPQEISLHTHLNSDLSHSTSNSDTERHRAFAELEKALESAEGILIAGHGKGKSSGPQQLMADLNKHMPNIARKVVGTLGIDEKHATEGELLSAAAKYYANINAS